MLEPQRRDFVKAFGSVALAAASSVSRAESPKKRIRIGQIGVGHAHAGKLGIYRRSPDYEVVGIVETDAVLRKHAETLAVYKDLPWMTREQLLNSPGLQAVLIETRVHDLLNSAEVCLAAGKHIHLDKPAGESLPQFRKILASAARQKLLVQMGYMYRYSPAVQLLRDFLKKGWLGEPFELHAVMSKVVALDDRRQLAEYPGGILFELGCHLIDLAVGLLGKPRDVQAFPHRAARSEDGLLDNMLAVFTYPGALATVKSSAVEVEGSARRHLVLCGTEGTFHIQPLDNPAARVAFSTARPGYRKEYQDVRFGVFERFVADAADMAAILRGEKESDFPYQHDEAVQETLLKACGLPVGS